MSEPSSADGGIVAAAQWLAEQRDPPHPIVPVLRSRFGINAAEACKACSMAHTFRVVREAHG